MTSLILDIETLSRRPDAIVTEIGALIIDRSLIVSGNIEIDALTLNLCIASQMADGRHFEPETIEFHRRHNTLPTSFTATFPSIACINLSHFIAHHQPSTVWIWGKDFDHPILESLFAQHSLPVPWQYWQTACARDAWKLAFGDENKPPKRSHKAIEDCRDTLRDLTTALKHLDRLNRL